MFGPVQTVNQGRRGVFLRPVAAMVGAGNGVWYQIGAICLQFDRGAIWAAARPRRSSRGACPRRIVTSHELISGIKIGELHVEMFRFGTSAIIKIIRRRRFGLMYMPALKIST